MKQTGDNRSDRAPGADPAANRLHAVDWAVTSGAADDVLRDMEDRLRRRRRRWQAGAASALVLLVVLAGWRGVPTTRTDDSVAPESAIVVSSPRQEVLADGSRVELKPGASIRAEFSTTLRRVVLERGEAHFQVTKNAARPFVVAAGAVEVRAVGTAFTVELTSVSTEVVVTEGSVAVDMTPAGSPAPLAIDSQLRPAVLEVGDQVVVETALTGTPAAPRFARLTSADIAERLAWRVAVLEFSGTPLDQVLPIINRHRAVKLVLDDARLGRVRISGVLRTDNAGTLLRLLAEEHGIDATPRGVTELVLAKKRER